MTANLVTTLPNGFCIDGPAAAKIAERLQTAARRLDVQITIEGDSDNPIIRFRSGEAALRVFEEATRLMSRRQ